MLSEEEKKTIEKFNNLYIKEFNGEPITTDDRLSYIEGALITNLIEKLEQELNGLKEIEQLHKEENGKLRVELEEEKEKNKELQKYEEAYKLLSYGLNNYICKDRVKAEMEDIIDYFEYANATSEDMEFLEKKKKEILEEK